MSLVPCVTIRIKFQKHQDTMLKNFNKMCTGEMSPTIFKNELAFRRVASMELFQSFDLEGSLCSFAIDSTGTYLLGGEQDGRVVLFDLAKMNKSVNCDGEINLVKAYPNKPCPSPLDVKWFPTNPGMFSTLSCGILKFFDANSDSDDPIDRVNTASQSKYGWPFSLYKHHPWNSASVIGMSGNEIRMYDLKVGAFVQTLTLPSNAEHFTHFTLSRRSPTVLAASVVSKSASGDSYIYEYDGRNWSQVLKSYVAEGPHVAKHSRKRSDSKYAHSRSVSYMDYSSDSRYLFSHSIDGVVKKWCTDSGKCLSESRVPGKILYNPNLTSMAVTETSPTVAIVPRKNSMYLMDLDNNSLLRQLKGHMSQITDVKYDPVFNRIFSVAKEHMLLIWESKGSAHHDREALSATPRILTTSKLFDSDSDDSEPPTDYT
ncbi:unnamed protein product [Allacma fusca]|uniref:Transducin/WD40 repeat-like superfamily protein n=1 Tax=Allacma fusca TaxID=39272 RepID=A0A8J2Q261_9HEXA|nr:unnamed protein product [Allacma fusca]